MKLRNKKTGEIGGIAQTCENLIVVYYPIENGVAVNPQHRAIYQTLAELNEEWEDYKEPEIIWYINSSGEVCCAAKENYWGGSKAIGNHFETKEEAEKAVEKLKAWKRLKDKGFRVDLWDYDGGNYQERIKTGRILFRVKDYEEVDGLLDLLFGGEE